MGAKIILSLSTLRENARSYSYKCPGGGSTYSGVQTNEAPVKYLLHQDRTISQVICLVTPIARKTALPHFQADIRKAAPSVELITIDAPDNGQLPDDTMANLLHHLKKGDTVYLDSSGGTRYTVVGLLHLTRILEFKGIKLKKVVYANIAGGKAPTIDDVTDLYQTLNLIGGMQELTDYGSVDTLRKYFKGDMTHDGKAITCLLDAIDKMTDAITLCRLEKLESAMDDYRKAMTLAEEIQNPITRELLDIFREKFGSRVTIPWVIRWCLEHRMLPQALGLYREWMPKYILRDSGLFTAIPPLNPRWAERRKKHMYQDETVFLWEQFLNLSQPEEIEEPEMRYTVETLTNPGRYLAGSGYQVTDPEKARQLGWDYLYIRELRNMVFHSNETAQVHRSLLGAFEREGYTVTFDSMSAADILHFLHRALHHAEFV